LSDSTESITGTAKQIAEPAQVQVAVGNCITYRQWRKQQHQQWLFGYMHLNVVQHNPQARQHSHNLYNS
jgi:hypothetical protein